MTEKAYAPDSAEACYVRLKQLTQEAGAPETYHGYATDELLRLSAKVQTGGVKSTATGIDEIMQEYARAFVLRDFEMEYQLTYVARWVAEGAKAREAKEKLPDTI